MKSYKRTLAIAAISILALAAMTNAATSLGTGANSDPAAPPAPFKAPSASPPHRTDRSRIANLYSKVPLTFERNDGQTDSQVKFLSRGPGYTLFLTERSAVLAIRAASADSKNAAAKADVNAWKTADTKSSILRVDLAGSRRPMHIEGEELQGSVSNYFIGKDKTKWRAAVANYGRVKYEGVYPGIDLAYHGNPSQLEYDFTVAPGADPRAIQLQFDGADRLAINHNGDLEIAVGKTTVIEHAPVVYQEIGGRRHPVSGGYALKGKNRATFSIARYDRGQPLVIDPILVYSTLVGNSVGVDYFTLNGGGMTVDASGNVYYAGNVLSATFPTTAGAYHSTFAGGYADVVVIKLSSDGTTLIYSTFIGGSDFDFATRVAVDASGNAYITGTTASRDFPITSGAFQATLRTTFIGESSAFVTKLNPTGTGLVYSTYLGGTTYDRGVGIAVDGNGNAYITGFTASTDFPLTPGAYQSSNHSAGCSSAFCGDAFVTKLNSTGTALIYSTYLGGSAALQGGNAIAVDSYNNAYIAGVTDATDFPVTPGAPQPAFGGGGCFNNEICGDAFVTKLNSDGSLPIYSTYLGGSDLDAAFGIAIDPSGNAYVSGISASTDFPITSGAFQSSNGGGCENGLCGDAFVAKLNSTGTALVYSTFIGGSGLDLSNGIAIDSIGNAYVGGTTASTDLPLTADAFQNINHGGCVIGFCVDAFVTELNPDGSGLIYSSYLGGGGPDSAVIAMDSSGDTYLAGLTGSTDFPTTSGIYQTAFVGGTADQSYGIPFDLFVTKLALPNTASGPNVQVVVNTGSTAITQAILTFFDVNVSGITTIGTDSSGPTPPPTYSLGNQPTYVEVSSTTLFNGAVTTCFQYDPTQYGDPTLLRLIHFERAVWTDVTTSNDTVNDILCGQVSSFSPFLAVQGPSSVGQPPTSAGVGISLGLGTVPVGDTMIKGLTIKNTGHLPLFVDGLSSSNPAEFAPTAGPCPAGGLAPSQTCSIPVQFTPLGVGTRTATLTLSDNAGGGTQTVALSGIGTVDTTVRPSSFSIYYTRFGTKIVKYVSVLNRQTNPITLSEKVSGTNAADFSITGGTCTATLAAKASCLIPVTFTPGVLSAETATLTIADRPDRLGPYVVPFNVAGTIPEIVSPLNLTYGTVLQSSSKTLKAIVINKSPFTISIGRAVSGPNATDFSITGGTCGANLVGNSSCTIGVRFKPTTTTAESAALAVSVNSDPTSPHNLGLTGTGM